MKRTENSHWLHMTGWATVLLMTVTVVIVGCSTEVVQITLMPTNTSKPPTNTPSPTSPPLPTRTPSPTVTLTTSPTPVPTDVNPLTGEQIEDPSVLDRVPVAIKISNYPGQYVRPQSGINSADLIFEHYNEGWFATRWTAIYLGKDPERVGPVRSGRLIDLELPAIYKSVLACSGFSNGVLALVQDSDLYPDRVASPSVGVGEPVFYRDFSRDVPLEHTMYSSPVLVRNWAAARGVTGTQELKGMLFSDQPTVEGSPAAVLKMSWRYLDAEWRYDETRGRYRRWSDGTPHVDALDGTQLSAANVVILYVPQWNTNIVEDPHSGALSIQFALWDSNRATILRDGIKIDAFWQRWARGDMLVLTDAAGDTIPLKIGNTFFEVVPVGDHEIQIDIEP